jgi:hypothetical protein
MTRTNVLFQDNEIVRKVDHLQEEALASYVDALLQRNIPQLPVGLLNHVENCPHCQAKILEIHLYLRNPLVPTATAQLRNIFQSKKTSLLTWLPRAGRVAAALFVVTLLASVYFLILRNDAPFIQINPENKAIADHDKTAAVKQNQEPSQPLPLKNVISTSQKENAADMHKGNFNKKTDAFAINYNLESMVDSRSRSFVVEVYAPANNTYLENQILFSWREFGHVPLNLVILNNRNETVIKSPVSNSQFKFTDKLPPGCYYWKLESADELYYVGKFFIASGSNFPK